MSVRQLDLFAGAGEHSAHTAAPRVDRPRVVASELDDDGLIAAILPSSLGDCRSLAAEAGRRRLVGAIDALEALCRRFQGFGREHAIPEQIAALGALVQIGGREAARVVRRIVAERIVQGPGLVSALEAAAELGIALPGNTIVPLLRHDVAEIRAGVCRCACAWPTAIPLLLELLDDVDRAVAREAACALGRGGRGEARPALLRLLREGPSAAVIDAVSAVADEECLVILGRIARTKPDLADAALAGLDSIGSSRALKIAAVSRRLPAS
jgi:HEAT repeat protein